MSKKKLTQLDQRTLRDVDQFVAYALKMCAVRTLTVSPTAMTVLWKHRGARLHENSDGTTYYRPSPMEDEFQVKVR